MNNYKIYKPIEGEFLRKIKLNFRIGNKIITDQFMWDVNNPDNSPEDFAEVICTDLGLSSEYFLPAAHSIRQQIFDHQKVIHTDKRSQLLRTMLNGEDENIAEDSKIRLCNTPLFVERGPPSRTSDQKIPQWNPTVQHISDNEVTKYEKQEERKARYEKRKK